MKKLIKWVVLCICLLAIFALCLWIFAIFSLVNCGDTDASRLKLYPVGSTVNYYSDNTHKDIEFYFAKVEDTDEGIYMVFDVTNPRGEKKFNFPSAHIRYTDDTYDKCTLKKLWENGVETEFTVEPPESNPTVTIIYFTVPSGKTEIKFLFPETKGKEKANIRFDNFCYVWKELGEVSIP